MITTQVADQIATKLYATEHAVDGAMVAACQLLESMVETRQALGISGTVGEVAQARAAEAIAALSEARRAVMASHNALADLQRKHGVTVSQMEDKGAVPSTGQASSLRIAG